jgi:hypothetical protein
MKETAALMVSWARAALVQMIAEMTSRQEIA